MAAKLLVDRLVDHAHAALAQPADDLVVPEQRARSQFFHSNILPVAAECGKYPTRRWDTADLPHQEDSLGSPRPL
jgi:hypothetical protein